MDNRIIDARHRTMTGTARGDQSRPARHLFRCPDLDHGHASVFKLRRSAFRDCELGVDLIEMLVDHEIDAHTCGIGFLSRFRQKDQIAVQRRARALHQNEAHQHRDEFVFIVDCSPAPDVPVLHHGAERIDRPLLFLYGDDVRMRKDQQRPFAAVSLEACDQIRPIGIFRESL